MFLITLSLQGCAWLTAVPEDQIPFREPSSENEGNRVANQVGGAEYKGPSMTPGELNELPEGAATEEGSSDRWNPVSKPVEPDEDDKPFKFENANGVEIKIEKIYEP